MLQYFSHSPCHVRVCVCVPLPLDPVLYTLYLHPVKLGVLYSRGPRGSKKITENFIGYKPTAMTHIQTCGG